MEFANVILILVVVAALVEAVWEALKPAFGNGVNWLQNQGVPVDRLAALIISLVICLGIGSRVDLFALLGLTIGTPYLGQILTAIILARGSNFVHDLLGSLQAFRDGKEIAVAEIIGDRISEITHSDGIGEGEREDPDPDAGV